GTPEGTYLVEDLWPGSPGSTPGSLTEMNGALFFSADDGNYGRELWRFTPDRARQMRPLHAASRGLDGGGAGEGVAALVGAALVAAADSPGTGFLGLVTAAALPGTKSPDSRAAAADSFFAAPNEQCREIPSPGSRPDRRAGNAEQVVIGGAC